MTQITDAPVTTDQEERAPRTPGRPLETGAWLRERVPGTWAVVLAIAWYALFGIAGLLEPTTHHATPVIGVVLEAALGVALLVMAASLIAGRRFGLATSVGASVLFLAGVVACPTTGHHTVGLWWFGQMVCALAMVSLSVTALRQARAVPAERSAPAPR